METFIVYPTKEQESAVTAFLESLNVQFEKKLAGVHQDLVAGVKKAEADFRPGDSFTFEEFKQQLSVAQYVILR